MTNKRKHILERIVRLEFIQFETKWCEYKCAYRLLAQITQLMLIKVKWLKMGGRISVLEARFMSYCVRTYFDYYNKRQQYFSQIFVNYSKSKCGKVHKMFII